MKALLNLNFIYRFFPSLIIALPLFTVFGSLPASAKCNSIFDCPAIDPTDDRFNPGELADPLKVWFEHNPAGLALANLDIAAIVVARVQSGRITNRQQCYSSVDTTVDNLNKLIPDDIQKMSGYSSLVQQRKNIGREVCNRQLSSDSGSGGDNTIVLPPISPRPGSQNGSSSSPSNKFRVRNRWNPNCLASIGNSQSMDNRVGMGTCDSSNSIWQWDGQQIRNGWNPNCLGSIGNSKEIDNPVVMGACGQSNAVWQWSGQQIKNGWNPFCLGSIGNSKAVDNPVVMGACGQSNAEWFIEPI